MPLTAGSRLGPYEVESSLGAGGMGEVYRARDIRLHRDVAIKILPDVFANDPERLARFQREAQVLASLNHPHIAHVYGLEDWNPSTGSGQGGVRGIVMEYVDGPTLADVIAKRPMPIDRALPIARQIADALEAAHEHGIVHRDLKPANIKVRPDGAVKVLDFGLAKLQADGAGGAGRDEVPDSPTITSPVMTRAGVLLGTAAYMSPEQVRGMPVDRRADIWALGCVLFEILTGRRLFDGATVSDTLADVLRKDIDWQALPADTPTPVRGLLRRCLARDPRSRLRDMGDARVAIEEYLADPIAADSTAVLVPSAGARWRRAGPWIAALIAACALTAAVTWMLTRSETLPPRDLHVTAGLGNGLTMTPWHGATAVLSPDGSMLAFVGRKDGTGIPQLYVRRLDQLQARALAGTENADSPFFSVDGQRLGFFTVPFNGKLNVVPVSGGAVTPLADAGDHRGGSWAPDGSIIFTPTSNRGTTLMRVSGAGGAVQPVTTLEGNEVTHRWPQVLPGGASVLFTAHSQTGSYDQANLVVASLNGPSRKIVHHGGYHGRYLPTGHLVFVHNATLFAAPFDLARLEVTGPAVPVIEGITSDPTSAGAQFAFANDGSLVYARGPGASSDVTIAWADSSGAAAALRSAPGDYSSLRFSPDGRLLAMDIGMNWGESAIWIYDWARDALTRLTFGGALDTAPVWSPDGRRIAFGSQRDGVLKDNMYWQKTDGTGTAERLVESKTMMIPWSWHPSGRRLAFFVETAPVNWDVGVLPIEGDEATGWKIGTPSLVLNSPYAEVEPMFSPDGRWLAYGSDESGRLEVYVRSFPGLQDRHQVSTEGGHKLLWSSKRPELFYETFDGRIMVASYRTAGDSFTVDKSREWSPGTIVAPRGPFQALDLHPDGRRFAILKGAPLPARDHVVLMLNFFDEVRRVAGAP
jgi:Tol biopolymer transport system component